uniref:Uncharacterized protein n=1 Tax=Plectus sambesii TaxID=2011161 RepID=A0A914VVQ6_9BILA
MPGRNPRRSTRCASTPKTPIKNQKQKRAKKEPEAQSGGTDDRDNASQSTSGSSAGVGTLAALLPPLNSGAAVSNEQLTSEQVERAALLATSVFSRKANEKSASTSRVTKQRIGKTDQPNQTNRRSSRTSKLSESLSSTHLKAPIKSMPLVNKKLLAKATKSSAPSSSQGRGAKYYRIKKPIDVLKDASTNTTEPWIVADPPERAPFDVSFKDKPADEDFSKDARQIIANLYDFFTRLGFFDPWKETLNATRLSSKQFLRIRAELTQVSHDHRY